ncbi:type II/IV secretion system ATPase subunit [Candidatus Woesearchaeota archaeon]|nr:type II/IV secretion system ATPase subunit [Candidatus Woesearchaeota archaeon]
MAEAETTAPAPKAQADAAAETARRKGTFYIDLRPRLMRLPSFREKERINIRYPLIYPYSFAHIFWDEKNKELVYFVEEPILNDTEREILKLIQLGLEEMINVSFIKAKELNIILDYLERNVQSILIELGTKVSKETYQKMMYYIYRDAVGLNQIEPLLNDYYIEDIECNGKGVPIYIVHRSYENMRTNIVYRDNQDLINFIEKLAQKAGRYVSYAKPLLDGTLPDGSRVNATYTDDVTTRGPTFTIRKFTKEPWTPIHLIQKGTATAEVFAFLWLAIEHKFNIMCVGETASGKTTFLNAIIHFIPPEARICSIEDTREINIAHENWLPSVTRSGFGIPNILGKMYGEITLFDLLKESFRQNPDYVIVGEIRGEEAYVLFQGMASGHPSSSTFHAASVETLVRRLQTPPISLSPSLIESLDIVCVLTHIKDQEKSVRRLKEVDEVIAVKDAAGAVDYNRVFLWDPARDTVQLRGQSYILQRMIKQSGKTIQDFGSELKRRTLLLSKLAEMNITNYKEVNQVLNAYYKNPQAVLDNYGIQA